MTSLALVRPAGSSVIDKNRSRFRAAFSFPVMLAAGLVLLTFWSCSSRFDDPDLWWHLKIGQDIWTTQQIPSADQYSFTAFGHPWIAHEWLSQLTLYAAYLAGGYVGLNLWLSTIASLIVVLGFVLCRLWSDNYKVSFAGGIATLFFLTSGLSIRPALLGYLFLVVELLLLYFLAKGHRRSLWTLPLLFIVWANCHGSFVFGLLVLAGILAALCFRVANGRIQARDLAQHPWQVGCALAACLLAPFINPIGARMVTYPLGLLGTQSANIAYVAEWAALDIHEPRALGFAAVIGLAVLGVVRRWATLSIVEWGLLLGTAAMAIMHVRMLPIFGIVSTPVLCRVLASQWDNYDPRRDHPLINFCLMVVAALMSFSVVPEVESMQAEVRQKEPVAAVEAIRKAGLKGPLLNDYTWGGYLIWANPSQKVFVDGRFDLYAWTGVLDEFRRWALVEEDPKILLDRRGIQLCLIRTASPMANVLPNLPEWRKVHQDALATVFARNYALESRNRENEPATSSAGQ